MGRHLARAMRLDCPRKPQSAEGLVQKFLDIAKLALLAVMKFDGVTVKELPARCFRRTA